MAINTETPEPINPLKITLAKQLRIRRFSSDIGGFLEYYFGHIDDPMYREWDELKRIHDRLLIESPLGHGKSWRITFGHPIHEICFDRNLRTLIVSKKAERASEFVERIGDELRENKKLINDFGNYVEVKRALNRPLVEEDAGCIDGFYDASNWTKSKFTVLRPNIFREPSFVSSGVGGQIEGLRLDRIIADDILDIEDRTSEIERENRKTWLRSTLLGRLEPKGKITGVGTPWHQLDAYSYLEELSKNPDSGWVFKRYQALPGWNGDVNSPVTPLLPWRWSWDSLIRKYYELGEVEFFAKYQCNPKAGEGRWFKSSWLKYFDFTDPTKLPTFIDIVMGVDLNMSDKDQNDYTAMVVMALDQHGQFYILDILREHMSDSHPQKIIDMWLRWKPNRIAVESNLFQRTIYKALNVLRPDCPAIPIISTTNKAQRILKMQPYFQSQRVFVNKDMPKLLHFVNEYESFPDGKNDDMMDALQMAFELLGFFNPAYSSNTGGISIMGGVSDYF